MTEHMTTEAQTQEIPRVPTDVLAVAEAEAVTEAEAAVADAGAAAVDPEAREARTESVHEMYEAGLAKLHALHDRWAAAVAEIREAQPSGEPQRAAA